MKPRLSQILKMQSCENDFDEMHDYIIKIANETPDVDITLDTAGNIFITKGSNTSYPAFVAHTDTSSKIVENFDVVRMPKNTWMGFVKKSDDDLHHVELGASAKCGIFLTLRMLDMLNNVKVAFYTGGEKHQTGALKSEIDFFNDCRWVMQSDRKGSSDIINRNGTIQLTSPQFEAALKPLMHKFKYEFSYGGDTDITALKDKLGLAVSGINISSGTWAVRTEFEHVVESHLMRSVCFAKELAETVVETYPHKLANRPFDRCKMENCNMMVSYIGDPICAGCASILRTKNIKCTVCNSGSLYALPQLYYQKCYQCLRNML
jgi:tripeptide aminopeptidase